MAKWERLDIYQRDNFQCRYCGFDGSKFETWPYLVVDHINPIGPRDDESNLATACQFCNSMKGNDPCGSVEEAKIRIAKHLEANRIFWKEKVEPRVIACRKNG
jgi:5-methylcytosine-specific restriction endonuclease McrA